MCELLDGLVVSSVLRVSDHLALLGSEELFPRFHCSPEFILLLAATCNFQLKTAQSCNLLVSRKVQIYRRSFLCHVLKCQVPFLDEEATRIY